MSLLCTFYIVIRNIKEIQKIKSYNEILNNLFCTVEQLVSDITQRVSFIKSSYDNV